MPSVCRTSRHCPSRFLALASIAAAMAAAPKAEAQSYYWAGGSYDLWSANFNWYNGLPSQSATTDLYFGLPVNGNSNVDNNGVVTNDLYNFYLRSLSFYGQAWYLGGKSLQFASGGSIFVQSYASISNNVSLDGSVTAFASGGANLILSGSVTGGGSIVKDGDGTMYVTGSNSYYGGTIVTKGRLVASNPYGNYAVNGTSILELATTGTQSLNDTISGTGSLVKSGSGTLTLQTLDNTYTGGTTVNDGRLVVRKPIGTFVTNGSATLEISPFTQVDYSTPITGTGNFAKGFVFGLTLSGKSTYQGSTTLDDGQLYLGVDDALPTSTALILNGGQLYVGSRAQTVGSLAGAGSANLGSGSVLTVNGSTSTTFSGGLSGAGALKKQGTGTLTLSGGNSYSGGTTVNAGTLVDSNPHGSYVTNGAGTLEFRNAGALTYSTPITGTGSFVKSGAGILTLSGANAYAGSTTVNAGTVTMGADGILPSSTGLVVNAGGTFNMAGKSQTVGSLSGGGSIVSGGGALTVGDSTATTFSGILSGTGSLTKVGAGTLTLSGANSYTGITTVAAGTLRNGTNDAFPTSNALDVKAGATYNLNGFDQTVGLLAGSGSIVTGGKTLTVASSADTTFPGVAAGNGILAKTGTGTLTLTGINAQNRTNVLGGTLIDLNPHDVYQSDAALELRSDSDNFVRAFLGTGNITKTGTGTLTVQSGYNFTGTTTVQSGRLVESLPSGTFVTNSILELAIGGSSTTLLNPISGTGSLVKSGSGELGLDGVNTYGGGTTINAGRLVVSKPSGTYAIADGNLDFRVTSNYDQTTPLTGAGKFNLTGSGTVTLSAANTYTGGTYLLFGKLIDLHPHGTYQTFADLQLVNETNTSVDAVLSDNKNYAASPTAGTLTKSGAGTLTVNSLGFTTKVTVEQGRLIIPTLYNSTSYVTNADLEFSIGASATINSFITGTGSVTKSGPGNLVIRQSGSYAGGFTVKEGTVSTAIDNVMPHGTTLTLESGTSINFNSQHQFIGALAGAGSVQNVGFLTVDGPTSTTFSGVISGYDSQHGTLTKNGTGTLTLTGANSYGAGTTVSGGRLVDVNPHGAYIDNATLEIAPAGAISFAGSAVTGTGAFVKGGEGTLTLTAPIAATGSISVASGILKGSTMVFDRDIASTGGTLQFDQLSDATFSRVFSGAGALLKTGAGALTLSGANTYTGSTTVSAGILRNGGTNALPTGTSLIVGSTYDLNGFNGTVGSLAGGGSVLLGTKTLTVNPATDTLFSGVISGTGSLIKGGAGTMTLSGVNPYSGGTTVNAGRLIDQSPHGKYVTNADLEFRNAATYNQEVGATITGTGSFTKSGGGNLVLLQPNNYGGATTLSEGTTYLSGSGSLPSSTTLTIASGATFAFPFKSQTVAALAGSGTIDLSYGSALTVDGSTNSTFDGAITYDGRLIKNGTGTLTLTAPNRYTGGTFIYGGRLVDQNPQGAYFNSASLEFKTATDRNFSDWIVGSGSFTKSGAGTLILSGNVTYGGGTTVSEGRLIDQSPHGNYLNNAALEFQGGGSQSHAGLISGTGSFTKSGVGTLTLGGINTYSGGTTVNAGRLIDQNPHGTYVDNAALEFAPATAMSLPSVVSGTGSLTKSGAGTLTLSGTSTYSGGTAVSAGILRVTGSVGGNLSVAPGATFDNAAPSGLTFGAATLQGTNHTTTLTRFTGPVSGAGNFSGAGTVAFNGGYSPGNSPASVTFQGDMLLGSSNVLTMELGGTTLGTGYDHLTVNGLATLGGSLTVAYYNGFSPAWGQTFDLFDFANSSGTFSSVSLPTLPNGLRWNTSGLYTNGSIQAVPEPAPIAALGLGALAFLRRRRKSMI